jgi:hypothetical protein
MTFPTEAVDVLIKNWPAAKGTNTVAKTYILDPAGVNGPTNVQICDYEPTRESVFILTVDSSIVLTVDPPVKSPDTSSATAAPTGAHLSAGSVGFYFRNKDPMWINSLAASTRVTVVKIYNREA